MSTITQKDTKYRSNKPIKPGKIHVIKVDHPYSGRITEILHEGNLFLTTLSNLASSGGILPQDMLKLEEAKKNAERVEENLDEIEKRMQHILNFTLKEYGIKEVWILSVDRNFRNLEGAMKAGEIGFTLRMPKNSRWKSTIRECPVYKALPLYVPAKLLDATPAHLRSYIRSRQ